VGSSVTGHVTATPPGGQTPPTLACTDSDGGYNVYSKGTAVGQSVIPEEGYTSKTDYCIQKTTTGSFRLDNTQKDTYVAGKTDVCSQNCALMEYGCSGETIIADTPSCPNGCKNGACLQCNVDTDCPELSCPSGGFVHELCVEGQCVLRSDCPNTVKEQVKCVFQGSGEPQKCYSDNGFGCSGTSTCVADVYGRSGEKVTWKSSCGGYAYTVTDGQNEYANFDCASSTCTYYRCVPAYTNLYLSTDKYAYNIGDQVQISTNSFGQSLNVTSLQVTVKDPYGQTSGVDLKQICGTSGACPPCAVGEYCPPCVSTTSCLFQGVFDGTKSVGGYSVNYLKEGGINVQPAYFKVYDYSLLKKYLILEDIDGFKYTDSNVQPGGPENIMGYMAYYTKNDKKYMALVADFGNRDTLQKYLNEIFAGNKPTEEKIDGNYIYVVNSGSQKVYAWTYGTFLAAVAEEQTYVTYGEATAVIPQTKSSSGAAKETSQSKDIVTGLITGMPVASQHPATEKPTPVNCGSDSQYSGCVCGSGDTKDSFMPPCQPGSACTQVLHYRCKQLGPTELLQAYLARYPSDIHSSGTVCEQKSGYCISSQDSCTAGFTGSSAACKTSSEKCCVKEVDKNDFLDIVMKLEGIRVRMDSLQRQSSALADYYTSSGDAERAKKFSDVTEMFKTAKGMIDNIVAKIRDNIDNTESIRDEVKSDVTALKDYIDTILKRMVS
jgi:hypothetical protein